VLPVGTCIPSRSRGASRSRSSSPTTSPSPTTSRPWRSSPAPPLLGAVRPRARRGISRARNAVLDACEDRFHWIAFTDDDCMVAPNWISAPIEAAARHHADVVYGRREWLALQPGAVPVCAAGTQSPRRGASPRIRRHAQRADGGRVGGPAPRRGSQVRRAPRPLDTEFFYRATLYGARIVYSAEPVVHETIPPHRATFRYQTTRGFYYAASRTNFHLRYKGLDAAVVNVLVRFLWQVPIAAIRLATAPLVWPFSKGRFKRQVLKGTGRLVGAAGAIAGGICGQPLSRGGAMTRPIDKRIEFWLALLSGFVSGLLISAALCSKHTKPPIAGRRSRR
jgi:Glycosyl transferase family 2